jgi:hypothetical protein
MSRSGQNMRAIAQRLTAYEAAEDKSSQTDAPAAFAVCEKLRGPLGSLSGLNGFRSLLSRAVALAGEEVRWLRVVQVKADGSLEGPPEMAELDQKEITDGEVVLAAELLGLLAAFIGEPLTFSLVREVWPRAPINDPDFNKKETT